MSLFNIVLDDYLLTELNTTKVVLNFQYDKWAQFSRILTAMISLYLKILNILYDKK